jgi:hypothetical protein
VLFVSVMDGNGSVSLLRGCLSLDAVGSRRGEATSRKGMRTRDNAFTSGSFPLVPHSTLSLLSSFCILTLPTGRTLASSL